MKISPTKNGQKDSKIYSSTIHKISNMYDPNLIKISDNPFPKIFLTKKLANNYPLFLKCYTFEEKFLLEAFQAEIQKTLQCTSKAYNDIIDFFIANEKNSYELYLFLERADFSLNELILSISENIPKPEPEILQIYSDLAYNLQLAHKNNFIHGNIHPQNILVFCNCRERPIEAQKFNVFTSNIYKLTDWMFDCVLQNQNMSNLKHLNQNTAFRAPEFFNFSKHELNYKACDVYSLGMSILHCCGVPLKKLLPIAISDNEIHDIQLSKIFQGILQTYDLKLCNILKMSLDYDPKERWNIDDVVEALKHLSKDSKIVQDLSNDLINGKKPKKGILKKLFSGMFGAKKNKPTLKDKGPEIQIIGPNNESLNEYFFNTKTSSLQVYSKEDYSLIFTQKHSKNSNNEIYNIWKQIKPQSLSAMKTVFRTENNLGSDNIDLCNALIKEHQKIQEINRTSLISSPEKVGGELGNFLANYYFSNPLMEGENQFFENSVNVIHLFQKNQNAGMTNEEIIIMLKNLHHFGKNSLKSLNLIFKSYEKLSDEALKNVGYLLQNFAEHLKEFNLFFTGQNISDEGVSHILKSFNETVMKSANVICLDKIGLGFGGKKKLTDASLIDVSKTLLSLSSRVVLTKLYLYFNSFELSNDGLDSLGTALGNLSKSLKEITIFLITWDQITDSGILLLFKDLFMRSKSLKSITIGLKSVGLSSEGISFLFGLLSKTESKIKNLNIYYEQMLYYIFSKKLNEKNRSNRNVDLEKNFKEKLARIHPEILFGEVLIKV